MKTIYLIINFILGFLAVLMFIFNWYIFSFLLSLVTIASFINYFDIIDNNKEPVIVKNTRNVRKNRRRLLFDGASAKEKETSRKILMN